MKVKLTKEELFECISAALLNVIKEGVNEFGGYYDDDDDDDSFGLDIYDQLLQNMLAGDKHAKDAERLAASQIGQEVASDEKDDEAASENDEIDSDDVADSDDSGEDEEVVDEPKKKNNFSKKVIGYDTYNFEPNEGDVWVLDDGNGNYSEVDQNGNQVNILTPNAQLVNKTEDGQYVPYRRGTAYYRRWVRAKMYAEKEQQMDADFREVGKRLPLINAKNIGRRVNDPEFTANSYMQNAIENEPFRWGAKYDDPKKAKKDAEKNGEEPEQKRGRGRPRTRPLPPPPDPNQPKRGRGRPRKVAESKEMLKRIIEESVIEVLKTFNK